MNDKPQEARPTPDANEKPGETGPQLTDRRAFLRRVGGLGLGLAGVGAAGVLLHQAYDDEARPEVRSQPRVFDTRVPPLPGAPVLVIVHGGDREAAVRRAVQELGGIGRFVRRGETVLVKPNIAWDRLPAQGANTDPEVVAAVVRLCREAGAAKVIVSDVTCHDARRSFERSGIWAAAAQAGAEVLLPVDGLSRDADLGGRLGRWRVLEPVFQAHRIINVPVVKHHGGSRLTAGMKNWYGVLHEDRRPDLHWRMDEGIAELAAAFRPTLTILDATRVMIRNGPQGGSLSDVVQRNLLAATTDPVAGDAWAATLLGMTVTDIPYIGMAQRAGLGSPHPPATDRREIRL